MTTKRQRQQQYRQNIPKKTRIHLNAKPETGNVSCVNSSDVKPCILRMGGAIDPRETGTEIAITRLVVGGETLVRIACLVVDG